MVNYRIIMYLYIIEGGNMSNYIWVKIWMLGGDSTLVVSRYADT